MTNHRHDIFTAGYMLDWCLTMLRASFWRLGFPNRRFHKDGD